MSTNINTKSSYIVLGTAYNSSTDTMTSPLALPAPHGLPFTDEFLADANRNKVGIMLLKQIGRTMYKQQIKFDFLPYNTFWKLNRWLKDNGYQFYVKYFSHTDGKIKVAKFYRGNMGEADPSTETIKIAIPNTSPVQKISVPKTYKNVSMSFIDMGETDVIEVATLTVT